MEYICTSGSDTNAIIFMIQPVQFKYLRTRSTRGKAIWNTYDPRIGMQGEHWFQTRLFLCSVGFLRVYSVAIAIKHPLVNSE